MQPDPSNPLPGYIGGFIRYGMGMLGPWLMGHHYLTSQGDVDFFTGLAITVAGGVWIILHNNRTAHVINTAASAPATPASAPNVPI